MWAHYTLRITDWFVMTDELQFVRLAMSFAENLSLEPSIRGAAVDASNYLYPLLLAPLYATLDGDQAYEAARLLNAALMSSTAIPVYLLTREVGVGRLGGYLVAALSVAVPWLALADIIRDDAAAYPIFAWAVLAMQRAIAEPGAGRDALALVAIALATVTRTQFVILAPALLLAVGIHEVLEAGRARSAPRLAARTALRQHSVLLVAAAATALALLIRGASGVLGSYGSSATSGDLLPPGLPANIAMHLTMVAVGVGVIPFTFALAWAAGTLFRPRNRSGHAFAVLFFVVGVTFCVTTSSFVLRNAGVNAFDRYFFYLVPLALVGMVACVVEGRRWWLPAAGAALLFAWLARYGVFAAGPGPYHQSPASAFYSVLKFHGGRIGLTETEVARWGGTLVALVAAAGLRFVPRQALLIVLGAALLAFGIGETRSVFRSMAGTQLGDPGTNFAIPYNPGWVDAAVSDNAEAALLAEVPIEIPPGNSGLNNWVTWRLWWDIEFKNERVSDAYVPANDLNADNSPFSKHPIAPSPASGRLRVSGVAPGDLPRFAVVDSQRADFRPVGRVVARTPLGLDLVRVERPWRTRWAVFGLAAGDAINTDRPVALRVFGGRAARLTVTVQAPFVVMDPPIRRSFEVTAGTRRKSRHVWPGDSASVTACLAAGDDAELRVLASRRSRAPLRLVNVRYASLPGDRSC